MSLSLAVASNAKSRSIVVPRLNRYDGHQHSEVLEKNPRSVLAFFTQPAANESDLRADLRGKETKYDEIFRIKSKGDEYENKRNGGPIHYSGHNPHRVSDSVRLAGAGSAVFQQHDEGRLCNARHRYSDGYRPSRGGTGRM
jgi:hypothetical protein